MILSFKLTNTGLELGKPYATLAKETNSVTVVDRGFDFYIKTDQYLNAGPLTFNGAGTTGHSIARLGLNVPFMTVYNTDGTKIIPGTGVGRVANSCNYGTNDTIQNAMNALGNYDTEYFYLGKELNQDTINVLKTTSDPNGVPTTVKNSWKRAETLIRLTVAGPYKSGSTKFVPGVTGYRYTLANNDYGIKYAPGLYVTPGFGAGPIKTIVKFNEANANGTPYDSTIIGGPTLRNPGWTSDNAPQCNFSNFYSYLSQTYEIGYKNGTEYNYNNLCLNNTFEPETIGYFESKSRDFSISPILKLENGELDIDAIRNSLNASKMSATNLISTVMTSNSNDSDTNPSIPSSPDSKFNSAFVKI